MNVVCLTRYPQSNSCKIGVEAMRKGRADIDMRLGSSEPLASLSFLSTPRVAYCWIGETESIIHVFMSHQGPT